MRIFDSGQANGPRIPASETTETGLRGAVINAIKDVWDPEIPVNLYDLGLIYNIALAPEEGPKSAAVITMTLTNPNCPVADDLIRQVQEAVQKVEDIDSCKVNLVWEPKWDRDMMGDEALLALGLI